MNTLKIEHNKELQQYNTFMLPVVAKYFARATDNDTLYALLVSPQWSKVEQHFILGGGSNVLFTQDYDGFVLKNEIKGINITAEDEAAVTIRVGAGESWHDFVMWSVDRGYWGLENLAYIPGTVGAAPVQNIGAYGVSVADTIFSVEYVELPDAEKKVLFKDECNFSYRNSIFKQDPDTYIITYVYFRLSKKAQPILGYGRLQEVLNSKKQYEPSPRDLAEAVIEIRKSKLPEVGEIGMAGSFFKNPVITQKHFNLLQKEFPDIRYFELDEGVKIPAGWLLEKLGYKGFQKGNVGNYKHHALIVTHNGKGSGLEVLNHVQSIIHKTQETFNITLEPEVNII